MREAAFFLKKLTEFAVDVQDELQQKGMHVFVSWAIPGTEPPAMGATVRRFKGPDGTETEVIETCRRYLNLITDAIGYFESELASASKACVEPS